MDAYLATSPGNERCEDLKDSSDRPRLSSISMGQLWTMLVLLVLATVLLGCASAENETLPHSVQDPSQINTVGWSDSPYITPDGQTLYFMYTPYNFMPWILRGESPERRGPDRPGHHPDTTGNPFGDSDLYVSHRLPGGAWSAPENVPVNDADSDACPYLLPDGSALYWQKGAASADIVVAHRTATGEWGASLTLPAPVNLPDAHETNPHVSPDERWLFFTSDRAGGFGDNDLYVAERLSDGTYGAAINLGATINSAGGEDQAWPNDDLSVLYFNNDAGIVRSIHVGGDFATGWSAPEPIKFAVDLPFAAEVSFSSEGNEMYFALPNVQEEMLVIVSSTLQEDGTWSAPTPLD